MGIKLNNFAGAEAWSASSGPLDPGLYPGIVTDSEFRETSKGNPQIRFEVTLSPDPDRGISERGRKINDFYVLTDKAIGKLKGMLDRIGFEPDEDDFDEDGNLDFDPSSVHGAEVMVRLGPPDEHSKGFNTVQGIFGPDHED